MKKLLYMSIIIPAHIFGQGLVNHSLIDFNTFEEQIQEAYPNPENQLQSVDGVAKAEIGSELFMLDNWLVALTNSGGENKISQRDSYSKNVVSEEQGTVLGVRIKFPDWPYSNEAYIKPKFPLLPFSEDGQYINLNNGVVTNVGSVKSVSMWASGRNFNFTTGLRVSDIRGKITEFGLGSLMYVGWRKLAYNNPFFSDRPINNIRPNTRIYPSDIPLLRFEQIAVYKPANTAGGDFVGYFGNIDIEYTPYLTATVTDIDDESTWGIISEEQKRRAAAINATLYEEILQYEYAKQRVESDNNAAAAE